MITSISILIISVILIINDAKVSAFRVFYANGVETILAMENENIKIQCKADMPMAYCGFIHPTGKRYSFSGSSLDAGQCAIKIQASAADTGEWRCHIGGKGVIGVEVMQYIDLRVVNELAAVTKNITTVHGKQVTLACATTKGLTPLKYCRFEPPGGKPFSINSDVTLANAILDRYYFPNNKSLDRGDCAVTIRKVKYEDVGTWACGAGFDDGKEHIDTITLDVEGFYTMSTASATGITFGAIGIAAFLAVLGFIVWKKRRFLGSVPDVEVIDEQELRHLRTQRSPHVSRQGTPHHSPQVSKHGSRVSMHESPHEFRHGSPHGFRQESQVIRQASPHVSRHESPQVSRQGSPHVSRHESPQVIGQSSPQVSRHGSPQVYQVSRQGSPHVSRHESPQVIGQSSPQVSRHGSPQVYPHEPSHYVPKITVQSPSPSEPSAHQ